MNEKEKKAMNLCTILVPGILLFAGFLASLLLPKQEISVSERRRLTAFPKVTMQSVLSGKWSDGFEKYAPDHFPMRDEFRRLKAIVHGDVFRQKDNNDIYMSEGSVSKLEYPLNEESIGIATGKFNAIKEKYLDKAKANVYYAIVPDKNFFLAEVNGYPAMDYERLLTLMREGLPGMTGIDLVPLLSIEDYYRTDAHWSQDRLLPVAGAVAQAMGVADKISGRYELRTLAPFYGSYYGQSALALPPDEIRYLTNEVLEGCTTYNHETKETTKIYDESKFGNVDPYDVFLSGATPLLTITNPAADQDRTLIVFRDSFGSSLVPLLAEAYGTIHLVDIRYLASDYIERFITIPEGCDVLFLYSTMVLNNSYMLK